MANLIVEPLDEHTTLINGVVYANEFFEALGGALIGNSFKVIRRNDGAITLQRLDAEEQPANGVMSRADWPFFQNGGGV